MVQIEPMHTLDDCEMDLERTTLLLQSQVDQLRLRSH